MLGSSIYYAWQGDSPHEANRYFIQDALRTAIERVNSTSFLWQSLRISGDIEEIAVTLPLPGRVFEDLADSVMVVADVTLVGQIGATSPVRHLLGYCFRHRFSQGQVEPATRAARMTPNPDILMMLGTAAEAVGWGRVVPVMNTHFGKPEDLPRSLYQRRLPIQYSLAPNASGQTRQIEKEKLVDNLIIVIKAAMEASHSAVLKAIARLDAFSFKAIKLFGFQEYFIDIRQNERVQKDYEDMITASQFREATLRLLDLNLIWIDPHGMKDAYLWTYLGRLVMAKLGIRN